MSTLDLHGYKVHDAWKQFNSYVDAQFLEGTKQITVIVGHGKMSKEIGHWVNAHKKTEHCDRQDPNTGAYIVKLRKNKHKYNNTITPLPARPATKEDMLKLIAKWNS